MADAWNRVTAEAVVARLTQPPADVSAMDGYALRAADGVLHATLTVIGAAPAGHPFDGQVGPGQAVRLFTGSVVPPGADAILLQEDATRDGDSVRVNEAVSPAATSAARARISPRATSSFPPDGASPPATSDSPPPPTTPGCRCIAARASPSWPPATRSPCPASRSRPAASSAPTPTRWPRWCEQRGGDADHPAGRGDEQSAIAAVADAVAGMDMLVTTGGASVGDHDLVIEALKARGMTLDFWQIAMRPGKPLLFGQLGVTPVLGLPGNPVSAMVCAILFLLPALSRLSGLPAAPPPVSTAILGAPVKQNDQRADHLRATVTTDSAGRIVATPFPVQDSAMLRRLALADALILRAPHAPALPEGAEVSIIRLDSLGL